MSLYKPAFDVSKVSYISLILTFLIQPDPSTFTNVLDLKAQFHMDNDSCIIVWKASRHKTAFRVSSKSRNNQLFRKASAQYTSGISTNTQIIVLFDDYMFTNTAEKLRLKPDRTISKGKQDDPQVRSPIY